MENLIAVAMLLVRRKSKYVKDEEKLCFASLLKNDFLHLSQTMNVRKMCLKHT